MWSKYSGCVEGIFVTCNMLLIVIACVCCSSIVSDDDPVWLTIWVRRWLISPIQACSTLPHSGHECVGPAEVMVVE